MNHLGPNLDIYLFFSESIIDNIVKADDVLISYSVFKVSTTNASIENVSVLTTTYNNIFIPANIVNKMNANFGGTDF